MLTNNLFLTTCCGRTERYTRRSTLFIRTTAAALIDRCAQSTSAKLLCKNGEQIKNLGENDVLPRLTKTRWEKNN